MSHWCDEAVLGRSVDDAAHAAVGENVAYAVLTTVVYPPGDEWETVCIGR